MKNPSLDFFSLNPYRLYMPTFVDDILVDTVVLCWSPQLTFNRDRCSAVGPNRTKTTP
jgi:hypothetical protein